MLDTTVRVPRAMQLSLVLHCLSALQYFLLDFATCTPNAIKYTPISRSAIAKLMTRMWWTLAKGRLAAKFLKLNIRSSWIGFRV